jgi:nitroreductase
MDRLAWKYEHYSYRVALMDAGVAVGTAYLVSEALGLSCCAVGRVPSRDSVGGDLLPRNSLPIVMLALGHRASDTR